MIDLTLEESKNRIRLKELTRVRETLAGHFFFDNSYNSTEESWRKYFYSFNYAARVNR